MRKILLAVILSLLPGLSLAANLTTVTVTSGVPTAGSGTVSTLDNLLGTAGASSPNVQTVQGISSMTPFLVSQSGTWNITNISGTVSLPTGAATSANQSTANASLSTIATNSGAPVPDCGTTPCANKIGNVYLQSQYPVSSTPITGNATGTTGAVVGTLAGTTGKTTYVCGLNISAIGGTASVGPITVAGLITSSMVYQLGSLAAGNTLAIPFSPCIPASATNTAITITTTADGTASAVSVNSWGFQQ